MKAEERLAGCAEIDGDEKTLFLRFSDMQHLAREAIALLRRAQLHIGREPHDAIKAVALQDLGLDMDKFLDGEQ